MVTPNEYRELKVLSQELQNTLNTAIMDSNNKIRTIDEIYKAKIDAIVAERDAFIEQERKKFAKQETQQRQVIEDVHKDINEIKLYLDLIDVSKDLGDLDFSVYRYSRHDVQGNYLLDKRKAMFMPYTGIMDDQYKKIAVYIVPNGKPVKRFSLFVCGQSIFINIIRNVEKYTYGSVNGIHADNAGIRVVLRDAVTEAELIAWFEKNKASVLKEYLAVHAELEKKYEEAKKLYESLEWQVLYLEHKKEYYEHGYVDGTKTPEYKQIISELEKLKVA